MPELQPSEQQTKRKADKYIWAIYIALCIISVIELYSASSREVSASNVLAPVIRHCMMLGLGVIVAIGVSRVPYKWFRLAAPLFSFLSVTAMAYVLLNGQIINGARRSFSLLGIQIQPAELLKISSVFIIAFVMSRTQIPRGVKTSGVVWSAAIVILFGGMLFSQGLTNTLLLMSISLSMMLIGGVELRKFLVVLLVYAVVGGAGLAYKMTRAEKVDATEQQYISESGKDASGKEATVERSGIWMARLERFFGDSVPKYEQRINDKNRQEIYSYMAQANGGIIGVGPGNSREAARLPLANVDYIYSIVVEDWGFIGGVILLALYLSLLGRAGNIAARCNMVFPALLVMGMAVMITLQALFHMAIVTGVFPVSGQPLPMISKGGTSILVTSIAFGVMLSVSRFAVTNGNKSDIKKEINDLPDDLQAKNPLQLSEKK